MYWTYYKGNSLSKQGLIIGNNSVNINNTIHINGISNDRDTDSIDDSVVVMITMTC